MDNYMTCHHIKERSSQFTVSINVQEVDVLPLPNTMRCPEIHTKCQNSSKVVADYIAELKVAGYSDLFSMYWVSATLTSRLNMPF